MYQLTWRRRLLGAIGAAALGFTGTAWAQTSQDDVKPNAEEAAQDAQRTAEDAAQRTRDAAQEAASDIQQLGEDAMGGAGDQDPTMEPPATPPSQPQQEPPATEPGSAPERAVQQVEETGEKVKEVLTRPSTEPQLRVTGNVGIQNWAGTLGDALNTGPQWGVSVGRQLFDLVGVEVGYFGQRNAFEQDVIESGAVFRHALDVMAKVGPRLQSGVRPYGGVGVGVSLVNPNQAASDLVYNDVLAEVPVAAGLDYDSGPLTAGVRGTWVWPFGEQFAQEVLGPDSQGSIFGASLTFGGRF